MKSLNLESYLKYINIDFLLNQFNLTKDQIQLTKDISVILIPLLITALLFFLSGWFFKSIKKRKNNVEKKNDQQIKINTITEIKEPKIEIIQEEDDNQYKEKFLELYKLTQGKKVILDSEENIEEQKIKNKISPENKFEKIIGINAKIGQILMINGVDSYEKLAEIETETINILLEKFIGSSFKIYQPETWNIQAKLIIQGKEEELKKYQEKL